MVGSRHEQQARAPGSRSAEGAPAHPAGIEQTRWRQRPALAALVRLVAVAVPLLGALLVAALVARFLPPPEGLLATATWWAGLLVVSLGVLMGLDRLARRLLPLAALLRLSLVFPDQAPSRLGVALRSGSVKNLRERAEAARGDQDATPAVAARTVLELAASLNVHDRGTRGHSERVRAYAELIAEELHLDADDRDRLRWAALLHDVGKLTVPHATLNSSQPLTEEEWAALRQHPDEGARLARPLEPWLGEWTTAISQHHERFDGTGYPRGLAGSDLSLAARIVAVADAYDAMTSVRSYSRGMSPAAAREELARGAGREFDPDVVRAFLSVSIGRLRWLAGPAALFATIPALGGFGGLRRVAASTGRTVVLGAAGLSAVVGVVEPQRVFEGGPAGVATPPSARLAPPAATGRGDRILVTDEPLAPAPEQPAVHPASSAPPVPPQRAQLLPERGAAGASTPPAAATPTTGPPSTVPPTTAPRMTGPRTTAPPTTAPPTTAPPTTTTTAPGQPCRKNGGSEWNRRPCQPPGRDGEPPEHNGGR